MRIIKNNWWNRQFHSKDLSKQKNLYRNYKILLLKYQELLDKIVNSKSLTELMLLHKEAWNEGFRNKNLGPCDWGMFRTEDIMTMKPEEVFIGNIYGIWTHNIPFWEKHKDDLYGINNFGISKDTKVYDLILNHYICVLKTNLKKIHSEAVDYITEYESLNDD